ncbi:MAG: magnesium transporter [Erysipelotrichaceae bacterium]|nr:magnesium transporter [Erysipelotrichaceae bacterium]
MNFEDIQNNNIREIIRLIRETKSAKILSIALEDFHDSDISDALAYLSAEERKHLYKAVGPERVGEIFSYLKYDVDKYISEININEAARIVEEMDTDDAVDLLDQIDDRVEEQILDKMDDKVEDEIRLIQSYDSDELGSLMTTNFIKLNIYYTVKQAMRELIKQSEDNDNIDMLYVVDNNNLFCGAVDLRDLIKARESDKFNELVITSYPVLNDHDKISECLEEIRDYSENSLPVLDKDQHLLGVITATDIIETVDEEISDDYAKLGGLSSEEDLNEPLLASMRKRLPWLAALLVLGIGVSAVVGIFEDVVKEIAIIVCFQSLVLDMAGNVGTQSLAVTIRVLMDEKISAREKLKLVLKEVRVGFFNGLLLGTISFVFIGLYIFLLKNYPVTFAFAVSACVGFALLTAMLVSSLVGTVVPIVFDRIHVDPAVASGPFITTINDLVAVVTYYGLSWFLLLNVMHL